MAQVKKFLEGGKAPINPELVKVYGFDYEKDKFFNTLNNNSNIDSYIYNSNMNAELASLFKDALTQYNLGSLTKDHPGIGHVDNYIKELIVSPALSVYKKKPKLKLSEGELFYKGFINKYYGGNKELYRDDWYERGDETSRANRIADYLSSMNVDDVYNTFDFSETLFSDPVSLKKALDELAADLRDGITDSDYEKANILGLNLKRWLQKPVELTETTEEKKKTVAPTVAEKLEELHKKWRQEAIDMGLTADLVDAYVQMKENEYNRANDLIKLQTNESLEREKIYKFLTDYYDPHEAFKSFKRSDGEIGGGRYMGVGGLKAKDTLLLYDKSLQTFFDLANTIIKLVNNGSKTALSKLGQYSVVMPSTTLADIIKDNYPKVIEKLRRLYVNEDPNAKLNVSDYALLKICNTTSYIPISGFKNDFLSVLCFNLDTGEFQSVPLFDKRLLSILESNSYDNNTSEKLVLKRVMAAFDKYVKVNYSDINIDNLKKALKEYEEYRSIYARTSGNNPWGTNAQLFINKQTQKAIEESNLLVTTNKEGGVLKHQAGGLVTKIDNRIKAIRQREEAENKKIQEATGLTKELYHERYEKEVRFGTSDFEFEDWSRFVALGADLVGLAASFVPALGTATAAGTGLVSLIADTAADFTDSTVSWGLKGLNFLKNVGLSFVGLLPGGKTGSVTAKLVRQLPRVLGLLGAANAAPEIITSFKKLADGKPMSKLDWTNIWDGGRILIAGGREAKAFRSGRKFITENTDLSIINIRTTNKRTISLTGKDAAEYRKLKTVDEKNTFLRNLNSDNKLADDESINLTHFNRLRNRPTATALPEESIIKGKYRFMTKEEVADKYNGFIPASYSRIYKTMQWYQNLGLPKVREDGKRGNIFTRAYTLEEFNERFAKSENTAGKNGAKRVAKQINEERAARATESPEVVQPLQSAAPQQPTSSETPVASPVKAPTPKSQIFNVDGVLYKQNNKGTWLLKGTDNRWRKGTPPSGSLLGLNFKVGGKLLKYILKAADGAVTPSIFNPYEISSTNYPFINSPVTDYNTFLNKYNSYFNTDKFRLGFNYYYDDWKKNNPNGTVNDFITSYNNDYKILDNFMKNRGNISFRQKSDEIGKFNETFNKLYSGYSNYLPEVKDIAANLTLDRIPALFDKYATNANNRLFDVEFNGVQNKVFIDNKGQLQLLKDGENYPVDSNIISTTTGNSSSGAPWENAGFEKWFEDMLKIEGKNLPSLESKNSFDLSVPAEMAKLLNTFITNKRVYDKAMNIDVPLKSTYHENSTLADIYLQLKYFEDKATLILQNALKLAANSASPELAQAIMLSALKQANDMYLQSALIQNLLLYKNQLSAMTAANDNLKRDVEIANANAASIAQVNEAKKLFGIEKLKSDSSNLLSGIDWFIERYNKARALKNTAQAQKLAMDLGLYYSDVRVKLANAYNAHITLAYNDWITAHPTGKYEDFLTEWNASHLKLWDEIWRKLLSWSDRQYMDALNMSSENPALTAIGVEKNVSTPPYRAPHGFMGSYKKGGSLTLEEKASLLQMLNLHDLDMLYLKLNGKRNLQIDRSQSRQSMQAYRNIAKLINKALGV